MAIEVTRGIDKECNESDTACLIKDAMAKLEGGISLHRSNRYGPYDVDSFSEGRFWKNREPLTKIVIACAQRELGWTETTARRIYEKTLRVEEPRKLSTTPSVLLFRREGEFAGVSAQRLKYIKTYEAGVVPVLYHILRGFEPQHREQNMGRDSIELARYTHREAIYYSARNGGPVPAWATMNAGKEKSTNTSYIFVDETFHPWERLYDDNSKFDRIYQEIMVELHMDIRTDGKWVHGSTGVSKGDYPEYNKSYKPRPDHVPTNALLQKMQGKKLSEGQLGMEIERGDSVITIAKFR